MSHNAAAPRRGDVWDNCGPPSPLTSACFLLFLFCSVGQVVNIKAKVNRAFNSSMEVSVLSPNLPPPGSSDPIPPWHAPVPTSCVRRFTAAECKPPQILPRFPALIRRVGPLLLSFGGDVGPRGAELALRGAVPSPRWASR